MWTLIFIGGRLDIRVRSTFEGVPTTKIGGQSSKRGLRTMGVIVQIMFNITQKDPGVWYAEPKIPRTAAHVFEKEVSGGRKLRHSPNSPNGPFSFAFDPA